MSLSGLRAAVTHRYEAVRDWIGENVVGEDRDYGSGAASDRRMRDYAMLGGAGGAALGGVVATVGGFKAQGADSIQEQWVPRSIGVPRLTGYSESVIPDIERNCTTSYSTDSQGNQTSTETCTEHVRGYWHNYSPRVSYDEVGRYTEPRFVHASFWEPLRSGFIGAMVGGLTGVALGVGAAALRKALESGEARPAPRLDQATQAQVQRTAGNAVLGGAVLGAGAGALVGHLAGSREMAGQEVHSRSWSAPVLESRYLGGIPRDHYDWFLPWHGDSGDTSSPVYRDAPVLHRDGTPKMQVVSQTFETGRYGPIAGAVFGGVIGAGLGVASGVAAGVAARMLADRQEQPAKA